MSHTVRQIIVYVIYFLIAIVFVGAIIIAITSKDKTSAPGKSESTQKTSQSDQQNKPDNNSTSKQSGSQTPSSLPSNSESNSTTQATSVDLANSGPGETTGLFIATAIIGYFIYRQRLIRQNR